MIVIPTLYVIDVQIFPRGGVGTGAIHLVRTAGASGQRLMTRTRISRTRPARSRQKSIGAKRKKIVRDARRKIAASDFQPVTSARCE